MISTHALMVGGVIEGLTIPGSVKNIRHYIPAVKKNNDILRDLDIKIMQDFGNSSYKLFLPILTNYKILNKYSSVELLEALKLLIPIVTNNRDILDVMKIINDDLIMESSDNKNIFKLLTDNKHLANENDNLLNNNTHLTNENDVLKKDLEAIKSLVNK